MQTDYKITSQDVIILINLNLPSWKLKYKKARAKNCFFLAWKDFVVLEINVYFKFSIDWQPSFIAA
jgi:hypothetical protein